MRAGRWVLASFVALLPVPGPCDICSAAGSAAPGTSIAYVSTVTDLNQVGLALTNYGFIGNNFLSRSPSFEYPRGTSYEHLPRAGLWVGAVATDAGGTFTGVTTAALDGNLGVSPMTGTEFTPSGSEIVRRSSLPASPYYSARAVSEMDYLTDFDDLTAKSAGGEPHRPLQIQVRQLALSWASTPGLEHALILRYVIRNAGAFPLTGVWVGMYAEFASGDRSLYSCWPPSSACSPVGSWFFKSWLAWEDSLRLLREHYCQDQPVPGGCVLARVPEWAGLELLRATPEIPDERPTFQALAYGPSDPGRDEDVERYALMSAGTFTPPTDPLMFPPYDPVELLAAGPFPSIAPGDSVAVGFAFVGGAEIADIESHARAARQAYDGLYLPLAVDPGRPAGPRLEVRGFVPNPAPGARQVAFRLPARGTAGLEVFDVAGRRVVGRSLGLLAAGPHLVDLGARLGPGVYLVRITQDHRSAVARSVILD